VKLSYDGAMASSPAPPIPHLAYELRETLGRLTRRLRAEPGPSVPHLAVLGLLDREGPKSVSDLAAAQRMRPQSMAQNVRELQDAGLVTRRPDPHDGRRAFVELTPAGTERILASRAAREDWLAQTLTGALDAGERERLLDALTLLDRLARA
jgi:DNA-binding MarR family transcriptional regulator